MTNILRCLSLQKINPNLFEVVLVEDRGGTTEGNQLVKEFERLNISYYAPKSNWGKMGFMRNFGLSKSKGEIVLFLDDDTIILDQSFLTKLISFFDTDPNIMAILPKGNSSFCILKKRYSYHDPYFFTNRCVAYRRRCLTHLKGFDNSFIGQEDVELAMRFMAKEFKYMKTSELQYFHPPLIVNNLNKPKAVGFSFAQSKYPFMFKAMLLLNGSRWLLQIIYPNYKNIQMAKFAFGFLLGFFQGIRKGGELAYV